MSESIHLEVPLGDRSYPVLVGRGTRSELAAVLGEAKARPTRAAIVTQPAIAETYAAEVQSALSQSGIEAQVFEIEEGEAAKRLSTIEELASGFVKFGLTRGDIVIGVGGGVVTDVAGFAAATYHRGTPVAHVATTLLAQIDAAIGGKTGVNLPQGKNLVGAFWQPRVVICDTETLDTLPAREMRAGFGELAKYHFLGAPEMGLLGLDEQVARCVRIKAEVVAADETESAGRALLNYGHTLAHALEASEGVDLLHGEAVAVGLHYAALVARLLGRIGDDEVEAHRKILAGYELDDGLPAAADHAELLSLFARDKKATAGFTFVLDGNAGLEVVEDIAEDTLSSALQELAATSGATGDAEGGDASGGQR